jgi:pimeloyl-ACP methyl ester carboxylesterase
LNTPKWDLKRRREKTMKLRIFTLLALLAILLGMAACDKEATPEPAEAATPTVVAPESTATVEPTREPVATFEETPCPIDLPAGAVEGEHIVCGYVTVPQEHAKPDGKMIRLAVAVVNSASDTPEPDPLVMLAGGPGQSALAAFVPLLAAPGFEGFRARREVVLVEQRGTLYSTPFLQCEEVFEFKMETLARDLSDEEEKALKLKALTACRDRFVEAGVNLSAYNSVENAADVVMVLSALGYEAFNLYGGSYGTMLAQHIMRDNPDRVRSAILDAVAPLRHEPNLLYKAHGTDRALRLLFVRCEADAACNEAYPDLEKVYFELVDRLNEDPAMLQIQNPDTGEVHDVLLTGDRLVSLTRDLLYATALLPDLPGTIYDMAAGDYTLIELFESRLLFSLDMADGLYNSVICTELADFTKADMADAEGLYPKVAEVVQDLIDKVMLQPCQVWGVEHLGDYVTESVTGEVPTLLLSGEFDPTVPPHLAEVTAEKLTNAHLYTFPGVGHSVLGSSECATSMMLAFLDDPTQAPDASCVDEMPGLVFRFPAAELELEPFTDVGRGFSGLVPVGWTEVAPANLARGSSAIDPTYFVLEATPGTAAELFGNLAGQLGLDPALEPVTTAEVGNFTWDFYTFELQGNPADLALAEDDEKAYFVFLISASDERDALYDQLFLPAVEAMAPLAAETAAEAKDEGTGKVEITLVPYTSEAFGISGVVPEGWAEAAPGMYARGANATDQTVLIQKSYPGTTLDQINAALLPQLGLKELPESVGSHESTAFTWDLYTIEVEAPGIGMFMVEIAQFETDAAAYMVLLQALVDDYETNSYHEAIFLPTVDALR